MYHKLAQDMQRYCEQYNYRFRLLWFQYRQYLQRLHCMRHVMLLHIKVPVK